MMGLEMFTWWTAKGRRLPWLIALVLVLSGGYAAVAEARPAIGAVPLAKVFLKSNRDAKASCEAAQAYYRLTWRCEGWWGGTCKRRSLTRPNYVWCGDPRKWSEGAGNPGNFQYFFMSSYDGRRHMDVWRAALYYAGVNGNSAIRLVSGTTKWRSRIVGGGGQG